MFCKYSAGDTRTKNTQLTLLPRSGEYYTPNHHTVTQVPSMPDPTQISLDRNASQKPQRSHLCV